MTAGAGILVAVLYVASTVDARSPEVIEFELTQPLPDDPDTALITTSLEVTFNEPVQLDAGSAPLSIEPAVDGTFSWSGSTLIFTPTEPLDLETEYVATVGSGIRDVAGNRIGTQSRTFAFDTAGRPSLVEVEPEHDAEAVPVDRPIRMVFSTLMDTSSVERALRVEPRVPLDLAWSGEVLEITPSRALNAGTEYEITIDPSAADVAGVTIGNAISVRFVTVSGGLEPIAVVPSNDVAGVAPGTPVAAIFDVPLDPESVEDAEFAIEPSVAGSLEVVTPGGDAIAGAGADADAGTVLRFLPSGALPLNTTFEVTLGAGLRALDGGAVAETVEWTFTTGAPSATVSNQIVFISDRAGVANVWAVNPDGSALRQVSTELQPVLDYAVSPDGSRMVLADGRRLISIRSDGSARAELTDDEHIEYDPAFAPNGDRLVFARADAASGEGLGLWIAPVVGAEASPVEWPAEIGPDASPGPTGASWLRAPRFSPDGRALAFVSEDGSLGILELPSERLTTVDARTVGPPHWLADSSAVLVTRSADADVTMPAASGGNLVEPLRVTADPSAGIARMNRSGTDVEPTRWSPGAVVGVTPSGVVAFLDGDGNLRLGELARDGGGSRLIDTTAEVAGGAFGPGEDAMAVELEGGGIEIVDVGSGERRALSPDGAAPRWLP